MDGSLLFNYTSLRIFCIGLGALRHHINAFYDSTLFINEHLQHTTGFTL